MDTSEVSAGGMNMALGTDRRSAFLAIAGRSKGTLIFKRKLDRG